MKRSVYALYALLGLLALGLLFTALNRYEPYQRFIDLERAAGPPREERETGIREEDGETSAPGGADGVRSSDTAPRGVGGVLVDLNSAGLDTLTGLPGVGPVTAANIIDYRARSGGFRSVDQLLEVRGIGAKKLEILKDYVIIETKE